MSLYALGVEEALPVCPEHPARQRCWDPRCTENAVVRFSTMGVCCGHYCTEHAEEFQSGEKYVRDGSDVLR